MDVQAGEAAAQWARSIDWDAMPATLRADAHFKGSWTDRQQLRAERKRMQVASFALVLRQLLPAAVVRSFGAASTSAGADRVDSDAALQIDAVDQSCQRSQLQAQHACESDETTQQLGPRADAAPAAVQDSASAAGHATCASAVPAASQADTQFVRPTRTEETAAAAAPVRPLTVVDFGSGTGNLALSLAWLFPSLHFVAVDLRAEAIAILRQRARDAGLQNIVGEVCTIESYRCTHSIARAICRQQCACNDSRSRPTHDSRSMLVCMARESSPASCA